MTLRGILTPARLRSAALPAACWAWTRGVLMMFVYSVIPYISHGDIIGDVKLYNRWSQIFAQGRFPQNDPAWQYPPGAGIVIAVPRVIRSLTGMSYYSAFYLLALTSDLIVFLLVIYRCWRTAEQTGHDRADYLGAYAYVAAIFMLGPIVFGRYDIAVTMIASVGLAVALRTAVWTWRVRGVAIGIGTIVKVWPIALVFGLPRGPDGRRAVAWAALAAVVPTLILVIFLPGALGFLTQQHDRGLEVESVLATPFLLARHLGYHGVIKNRYGSFEILGPGIASIARFCELLTLLGFCWLLWWRRRARLTPRRWSEGVYYDAALVAVLISIITSRVLSPQYLVWICGLIALCLALTPLPRGGTVLAGPCWLLMATISITQLEFPLLFSRLLKGNTTAAVILTCRNGMLVIATVWAGYLLWRAYAAPEKQDSVEATVSDTVPNTDRATANGGGALVGISGGGSRRTSADDKEVAAADPTSSAAAPAVGTGDPGANADAPAADTTQDAVPDHDSEPQYEPEHEPVTTATKPQPEPEYEPVTAATETDLGSERERVALSVKPEHGPEHEPVTFAADTRSAHEAAAPAAEAEKPGTGHRAQDHTGGGHEQAGDDAVSNRLRDTPSQTGNGPTDPDSGFNSQPSTQPC